MLCRCGFGFKRRFEGDPVAHGGELGDVVAQLAFGVDAQRVVISASCTSCPRNVAQMPGIQQSALHVVFQHIKHRLPIQAVDSIPTSVTPIATSQSRSATGWIVIVLNVRGRLLASTSLPRRAHTRNHGVLVDVQASTPLDHNVHGFLPGPASDVDHAGRRGRAS
jgi:hypothetical protein